MAVKQNTKIHMKRLLDSDKELFSVKETSVILNTSEKSVRRIVDRRILEKAETGLRMVLITRTSIERLLKLDGPKSGIHLKCS